MRSTFFPGIYLCQRRNLLIWHELEPAYATTTCTLEFLRNFLRNFCFGWEWGVNEGTRHEVFQTSKRKSEVNIFSLFVVARSVAKLKDATSLRRTFIAHRKLYGQTSSPQLVLLNFSSCEIFGSNHDIIVGVILALCVYFGSDVIAILIREPAMRQEIPHSSICKACICSICMLSCLSKSPARRVGKKSMENIFSDRLEAISIEWMKKASTSRNSAAE